MTKSWDDVREHVCRLYLNEGKSLSEIERILRQERNFQASIRAYRMKLKEWKAKRLDNPVKAVQVPAQSHSSERSETTPEIDSTSCPRSPANLPESGPTQHLCVPVHFIDTESENDGGFMSSNYVYLGVEDFSGGATTVLHRAARKPLGPSYWYWVEAIIDFMDEHEISIDTQNGDGMTAFEIAITSDNDGMIETLLMQGASVHNKNGKGEQPLHVALRSDISNKAQIVLMLLEAGADAQAPIVSNDGENGKTPAQLFLNHMGQCTDEFKSDGDYELLYACLKQQSDVLKPFYEDIEVMSQNVPILQTFLRHWKVPSSPKLWDEDFGAACLQRLLWRGFDPFVHGSGGYLCPTGHCKDFVSLAFFHAAETTCAELIIDDAHTKYTQKLVVLVLEPCASRVRLTDRSLSRYLRRILTKRDLSVDHLDILPTFMSSCLRQDDERPELLRVVLDCSKSDIHRRELTSGCRPLSYLAHIPEPLKWQLAEILLSKDVFAAPFSLGSMYSKRFITSDLVERCLEELISFCTPECVTHNPNSYAIHVIAELRRCVIHVLTKLTAEGEILACEPWMKAKQLGEVLLLRRGFQLPDIPIDNSTLYEALYSKR